MNVVKRLDHMVRNNIRRTPEPERRETAQHVPFKRNTGRKYHIKSGDAVCRHHEQMAPQIIGIPDLAADKQG
jgi:hypothetical protein